LEIGSEKEREEEEEEARWKGETGQEQGWAKADTRPPLGVSVDPLLRSVVLDHMCRMCSVLRCCPERPDTGEQPARRRGPQQVHPPRRRIRFTGQR
jgi:hypothetical protein